MIARPFASAAAVAAVLTVLAGCSDATGAGSDGLLAPTNLTYQLVPSGDPYAPEALVLRWSEPSDGRVTNYVVYSRESAQQAWSRRAETTSPTFHDAGVPHLQYYVAAQSETGEESAPSNVVTVDERNRLGAPTELASVSLDGAVQLSWSDASRLSDPDLFDYYRVYSAPYSLDAGLCDADYWVLEGTTVSEDFLASGLPNGAPRCFAVSTVSHDGHESLWTTPRADTPRPDARNEFLFSLQSDPAQAGFRFVDPQSGALGVVLSGSRTDLDFRVEREVDGRLYLVPVRADSRIALYSVDPVEDLTSIDLAPVRSAFSRSGYEAVPGYAYVFEIQLADGLHYAAVRVTHVSDEYVLFDWAYQTDPGNPELVLLAPR